MNGRDNTVFMLFSIITHQHNNNYLDLIYSTRTLWKPRPYNKVMWIESTRFCSFFAIYVNRSTENAILEQVISCRLSCIWVPDVFVRHVVIGSQTTARCFKQFLVSEESQGFAV